MVTLGTLENTSIGVLIQRNIIKRITKQYYYLPISDGDYNFFYINQKGIEKTKNTVAPIEFLTMLTDLSDKVTEGNTFGGVARCLDLPNDLIYRAIETDKQLAKICI